MAAVFAAYRPVVTVNAARVTEDSVADIVAALTAAGFDAAQSRHPAGAVLLTTERGREVAATGDWVLVGPVGPFIRADAAFAAHYVREETPHG